MLASRYELKLPIPAETRERFLEAAGPHLEADPHGDSNAEYRVNSLYFDSYDRECYHEKLDGVGVRKKYRLRFYGDILEPGDLQQKRFFMEIKHRRHDTVFKERIEVPVQGALELLEGKRPLDQLADCVAAEDRDKALVSQIVHHAARLRYRPSVISTYVREAWMGQQEKRLRVTFDKLISATGPTNHVPLDSQAGVRLIPQGWVLMEVKFDQRIPTWIKAILTQEQLQVRRFSKYANGLEKLYGASGI